jgi:hypothetical protein
LRGAPQPQGPLSSKVERFVPEEDPMAKLDSWRVTLFEWHWLQSVASSAWRNSFSKRVPQSLQTNSKIGIKTSAS